MKIKRMGIYLFVLIFCFIFSNQNLRAQGHFELGFHYSQWSIDILRGWIEESLSEELEGELRDEFLYEFQKEYPSLREISYSQNVSFDSGGDNYGFEIRWYPGGHSGSFSLGFSIEKTTMRVSLPEVSASMTLKDDLTGKSGEFQGSVRNTQFEMSPMSFHLSFRWDINPSWKVRPFITFGVGAASGTALEEGKLTAEWSGDLTVEGEPPEHYSDSESKTLKELKDEAEQEGDEFFLPDFLPFVQFNLGIKGVIAENFHILIDAGIWNGFILRGGIAIRI
ncbi:MAG: hypothetical protein JSV96_15545 [Candidatus Aminicenantes bacterium]|nr:MAG: hypothetical protein JSV96_15545 [Candidatus Aminicenantes bacterium]